MTKLIQYVLGVILLISGFVKLNDPLGFAYKLEEYYSADVLDLPVLMKLAFVNGFMVSLFEVILGVAIIVGWRITQSLILSIAMFVFFGFLTFYSAYFNKVSDCGCFGDAIHFTPWQSFSKDMFLLALTIFLWFRRKYIEKVNFAYLAVMFIIIVGSSVSLYAINRLPLIDFRPYKLGTDINEAMLVPEGAEKDVYKERWYYKVNDEVKEFSTDDAPWDIDGAEFVERKTELISKGYEAPIHDFSLVSDGDDFTDETLSLDDVFCVILLDINLESDDIIKVRDFIDREEDVVIISPSSDSDVDAFMKKLSKDITVYSIDETTCKTIIRANPGILRLNKGVIIEKYAL
ncbi:MAG: DoxX family protein [Flavobacteriales bacterium]|nr:DoxX family protein [Flavobacteriales bacterium]